MKNFKDVFDNCEHLPYFLKDFHDQKDFFKLFYDWASNARTPAETLNWVEYHILTIDYFLRFLAFYGYTLQKWRKKDLAFGSIEAAIAEYKREMADNFQEYLKNRSKP